MNTWCVFKKKKKALTKVYICDISHAVRLKPHRPVIISLCSVVLSLVLAPEVFYTVLTLEEEKTRAEGYVECIWDE